MDQSRNLWYNSSPGAQMAELASAVRDLENVFYRGGLISLVA